MTTLLRAVVDLQISLFRSAIRSTLIFGVRCREQERLSKNAEPPLGIVPDSGTFVLLSAAPTQEQREPVARRGNEHGGETRSLRGCPRLSVTIRR